jgi:hypothetical protein
MTSTFSEVWLSKVEVGTAADWCHIPPGIFVTHINDQVVDNIETFKTIINNNNNESEKCVQLRYVNRNGVSDIKIVKPDWIFWPTNTVVYNDDKKNLEYRIISPTK